MLLLIYANILLFYIYIVICFEKSKKFNFSIYYTSFLKYKFTKKKFKTFGESSSLVTFFLTTRYKHSLIMTLFRTCELGRSGKWVKFQKIIYSSLLHKCTKLEGFPTSIGLSLEIKTCRQHHRLSMAIKLPPQKAYVVADKICCLISHPSL